MPSVRLPSAVLACALAAGLAPPAADAGTRHAFGDGTGCRVDSPYTLRVDAGGLRLDDAGQAPHRVEIHDGTLRLDGAPQPVSAADAARLRGIEAGTRALLPDVAAIARETINISFDAVGGVGEAMTGSRRQARQIEALRARALDHVARTLDRGVWEPDAFGERFEAEVEAAAEAMAASLSPGRMLWMAFTGGIGRMERRLEKMEADLERGIAAREATLEAHTRALCARLEGLHGLQRSLEFRLDDGRPLRLFDFEPGGDGDGIRHGVARTRP